MRNLFPSKHKSSQGLIRCYVERLINKRPASPSSAVDRLLSGKYKLVQLGFYRPLSEEQGQRGVSCWRREAVGGSLSGIISHLPDTD